MSEINEHKKVLNTLVELIGKEKAIGIVIDSDNNAWQDELDEQINKAGRPFNVQIIGTFNSGKSTFVNALLGQELLPTSLTPETGVLTEIYYSEKKSITLYPKKGATDSDEPIELEELTPEAISRWCSINTIGISEGKECAATSLYERLVITWPLEILKDGIVITDTVGLNDPYGNDYITRRNVPRADAIIYLMNGLSAYQDIDAQTLTEINDFGIDSIIFCITHYDLVLNDYEKKPGKLEDYKTTQYYNCGKHSKLAPDGIFFVDSLGAVSAKQNKNQSGFLRSGFSDCEKYLWKYLVDNKGRAQVQSIINIMRSRYEQMKNTVATLNKSSELSEEALESKIKDDNERIALAQAQHDTIAKQYRIKLSEFTPELNDMVDKFLDEYVNDINLDDYNPKTILPAGLRALNPIRQRKLTTELSTEIYAELNRRFEVSRKKWIENTVLPFIDAKCRQAAEELSKSIESYANIVDAINVDIFSPERTANASVKDLLACGITGGLLDMALGLVYGKDVASRITGAQLGVVASEMAALAIGIPLSIPFMAIVSLVTTIIVMVDPNEKARSRKTMERTVKEFKRKFPETINTPTKAKDGTVIPAPRQAIKDNFKKIVLAIADSFDKMLEVELDNKVNTINTVIKESSLSKDQHIAAIDRRNKAIKELDDIIAEVGKVEKSYISES